MLKLQNDTNFALLLWVILEQDDIWFDKKKLKTPLVKLQFLRWLQNAGFCKICEAFRFFLLNLTMSTEKKLIEHISSLTGRFWKQLILLNKANFVIEQIFKFV